MEEEMEDHVLEDGKEDGSVHRLSDSNSDSTNSNHKDWMNENEDRKRQRSMYDLNAAKSFNEKLDNNKMTGYLEKRSKMLGWKRFWFVLDGRLLTYFKSKSDYESLCAFSGSINLGIATHVSPIKASKGFPFQIVTRTQVYYLRTLTKQELDRWLISIQEAATIPPNISLPVWVDPGIQFYRYSFTSVSQWSLNASTEDLTSSKNLPLNFYRPSSILKKCHSFASLNFNGKSTTHSAPTTLINNNKKSSTDTLNRNNNNKKSVGGGYQSKFTYSNHSNTIGGIGGGGGDFREMQEIIPRTKNIHKMRHTSSMLVLESSAQAGELRRELAQKLGSPTVPSARSRLSGHDLPPSSDSTSTGEPDQPQMIFPKTLRSYNQQTLSTGSPGPGLYTNERFGSLPTPVPTDVNHEYDEIIELDHGIYEPVQTGSPLTGQSDKERRLKKTESIYENVETQNSQQSTPAPTTIVPEDPWERLPNFNQKTGKINTSPTLALRHGGGSEMIPPRNRRSLQHRESGGRNSLGSIAEIPEKEPLPPSNLTSAKERRDTGGRSFDSHTSSSVLTAKTTPSSSARSSDTWDSRSSDRDKDDDKSDGGKKKKKRQMKKGTISRFLQKIFTKSDGGKRKDGYDDYARDMVITGPVDLRNSELSSQERLSRNGSSKRASQTSSTVSNLDKSRNMSGSKPAVGSSLISSDKLLEELNQKIGQMKRSNSDGASYGFPTTSSGSIGSGPRERRSIRKSASYNSDAIEEERSHIINNINMNNFDSNRSSTSSCSGSGKSNSHSRSGSNASPSISSPLPDSTMMDDGQRESHMSSGDSDEFLRKLARFNRLSASLNPSFVAALQHSHGGGNINNNSKIGRSYSCRVRHTEEPPVLPPKRKQCPRINVYDIPKNNSPVIKNPTDICSSSPSPFIPADTNSVPRNSNLRELTKKSSAPDISFSATAIGMTTSNSSTSDSTSSEPTSLLRRSLLESQDQVFSADLTNTTEPELYLDSSRNSLCKGMKGPKPPPRPPKTFQTNSSSVRMVTSGNDLGPQVCDDDPVSSREVITKDEGPEERNESETRLGNCPCDDQDKIGRGVDSGDDISRDNDPCGDKRETSLNVMTGQDHQDLKLEEEEESEKEDNFENQDSRDVLMEEDLKNVEIQSAPVSSDDVGGECPDVVMTTENSGENLGEMNGDEDAERNESELKKTELTNLQDTLSDDGGDSKVDKEEQQIEVKDSIDSCIQSTEILEAPLTSLATMEMYEQSNKSTLKYVQAPIRHHAEILEIPDLLQLTTTITTNVRTSSPTPSEGMEILSDISNSSSPPVSPLEVPPNISLMLSEVINRKKMTHTNSPIFPKSNTVEENHGPGQILDTHNETRMKETDPVETNNEQILKPLVSQSLDMILDEEEEDGSHHYDDVPFEIIPSQEKEEEKGRKELPALNYASCHSVAWETVEETEEEVYELYDDFPADEYIFSATASPRMTTEIPREEPKSHPPSVIRHSGIEQLQAFLADETNVGEIKDKSLDETTTPGRLKFNSDQKKGRGAVNRLGHSSAIEQLKKIVSQNE